MDQSFDVFLKNRDGSLIWRSAANSLDEAETAVERLGKTEIGAEFVILNQETQEQITVKPAPSPRAFTATAK